MAAEKSSASCEWWSGGGSSPFDLWLRPRKLWGHSQQHHPFLTLGYTRDARSDREIGRVCVENPARQRRRCLDQPTARKGKRVVRRRIQAGVVKSHAAIGTQNRFANERLAAPVSLADLVFWNIVTTLFNATTHAFDRQVRAVDADMHDHNDVSPCPRALDEIELGGMGETVSAAKLAPASNISSRRVSAILAAS